MSESGNVNIEVVRDMLDGEIRKRRTPTDAAGEAMWLGDEGSQRS